MDSLLVPNYIYVEEDPQALFTPTPTVFKDLSEQVTFNQTIGANSFVWNFGDGGQSTLSDPSHWYDNTIGGHTIYLIAFSPLNCTDTTSFEIPYEEGLVYFIPNFLLLMEMDLIKLSNLFSLLGLILMNFQ